MPMSTYGDITSGQALLFIKKALKTAEAKTVLGKYITPIPVDQNLTDTVKVSAPNLFPVLTTPLAEGVTPTAQQLTYRDVSATVSQYGAWVELTDKAVHILDRKVKEDCPKLLAQQAAETAEYLNWQAMIAGNQVFYANGAARSAVNTQASLTQMRNVVRLLKRNRAEMVTEMSNGSLEIGTRPIEASYLVFCHTDLETMIRGLTGFVPTSQYGGAKEVLPSEFGSVDNMRFITTAALLPYEGIANVGGAVGAMIPNAADPTKAAVYPMVFMGMDSAHQVAIKGMQQLSPKVRLPGPPTDSDPLGQRGSVATNFYWKTFITNEAWIARIETATTL